MSDSPAHNEPLIEAISEQLPLVTTEQVAMVLEAWNTITTGEPLGTVLRSPDGHWPDGQFAVAYRVAVNGIHQWQVTNPDGGTYIDRSPSLAGWKVVVRPGEGATAP